MIAWAFRVEFSVRTLGGVTLRRERRGSGWPPPPRQPEEKVEKAGKGKERA